MGLDMYLKKRTFIGANYEHQNVKGAIELTTGKNNQPIPVKLNRLSSIEEAVGYWRKANHIHLWFVTHVQHGKDECQLADVSLEQLEELLNTCKHVLADHNKAESLLPTKSGFFFGGTEYDEWYFKDIENTIEIIEPLIAELKAERKQKHYADIYYKSSW